MASPLKRSYSRLETDEEVVTRVRDQRWKAKQPMPARSPGDTIDAWLARNGEARRLIWVDPS